MRAQRLCDFGESFSFAWAQNCLGVIPAALAVAVRAPGRLIAPAIHFFLAIDQPFRMIGLAWGCLTLPSAPPSEALVPAFPATAAEYWAGGLAELAVPGPWAPAPGRPSRGPTPDGLGFPESDILASISWGFDTERFRSRADFSTRFLLGG